MTQTYKVQVSMNQAHLVESGIVWKQGDFGFNLEIEVLDFDTTGVTPQIVFRKSAGAVEATEITQSSNKFTYVIRGTELDTPGPCICDLKLKDSTTKRVSTASFKYFVIPDTLDGLAEESSSYSDTIAQLMDNCIQKSETTGLVKNDGSINTTIEGSVEKQGDQIGFVGFNLRKQVSIPANNSKVFFPVKSGEAVIIKTASGSAFTVGEIDLFDKSGNQIGWYGLKSEGGYLREVVINTDVYYWAQSQQTLQELILINEGSLEKELDNHIGSMDPLISGYKKRIFESEIYQNKQIGWDGSLSNSKFAVSNVNFLEPTTDIIIETVSDDIIYNVNI